MSREYEEMQVEKWVNLEDVAEHLSISQDMNTPPETVPLDRTNGALRPLKWCMVTAVMVH